MTNSIGDLYRQAAHSFIQYANDLNKDDWATPVGCCPGWTARDVLSHAGGSADDIINGRVDGAGTPPWTASQVERYGDLSVADLLAQWTTQVDDVASLLEQFDEPRPPIDVHTHEHDIRSALNQPGSRDNAIINAGAARFAQIESTPSVTILLDGSESRSPQDEGNGLVVGGLSRFELVRSRLGRRSRSQVERYDWSGDPSAVLDSWFLFGPAEHDIVE